VAKSPGDHIPPRRLCSNEASHAASLTKILLAISGSRDAARDTSIPHLHDRGFAGREWPRRLFSLVSPSMMTLREILQTPPRELERRAVDRTTINRDVLMFFAGQQGVRACCVRNVTNHGAGLRLNVLSIVPSEFGISFDNFRTMRRCRLVWRDGDFVGVAFES
jgi:hypothetical protein